MSGRVVRAGPAARQRSAPAGKKLALPVVDGPGRASGRYAADEPRGLDTFALYRPRAGHPDWPALAHEAAQLVEALRPRLEPPRRGPRRWRRTASSYGTATRNFLTNRRLTRSGREDLRPLYFIWTLLRTCNFACEYCDDHRGRKYPDLPNRGVLSTDDARRLLRIMRTGTSSVYFAGGEPTLRKDLPELTREARDLGFYPIVVNTNASVIDRMLARPGWHTWLADTDTIVVSLDALDLSTLARMWRTPRPHHVLRNLLLLRELAAQMRVKLMVNTVIQPGLVQDARDVLDFANDLGLWFCPVPVNVGPRVDERLLADPDYRALAELILARHRAGYRISGSRRMNRRLLFAEPADCRNTLKPHVDFDGTLLWPCKASVNVEPEAINVLDFEDVESLYRHATGRIDPTGFCGTGADQCGAACNWAQNYSTDAYVHGLHHPLGLVRDAARFLRPR